jgi:hypothetical protein
MGMGKLELGTGELPDVFLIANRPRQAANEGADALRKLVRAVLQIESLALTVSIHVLFLAFRFLNSHLFEI